MLREIVADLFWLSRVLALAGAALVLVLVLYGCGVSPVTQQAMKAVEHQDCVWKAGSYVDCRDKEVYK